MPETKPKRGRGRPPKEIPRIDASPEQAARVRPYTYQPSKAEIEEDVSVNATPEEVRAALMRHVVVKKSVG